MTYPEGRMEQHQAEIEQIVPPDLANEDSLNQWLDRYVDRPFIGFEDKKHPDGTPFSYDEQVQATRDQFRQIAQARSELAAESPDWSSHTSERIAQILVGAVESLRKDSPPPPDKSG